MRISVIGAGYVGLVTGACLAGLGHEIVLIDIDADKLAAVSSKTPPFFEEGLDKLLSQVHIEVSADYGKTVGSEVLFICVGTPSNSDGSIFLESIRDTAKDISQVLGKTDDYCVVTVKSSVAAGTTEELVIPILAGSGRKIGRDFGVCMAPEFLREGKAIYDFMHPARLIIGEYDRRSGDTLLELYRNFKAPVLRTNLRTAEMIKLAANAFLATKVSFINEIGNICKQLGVDVYEVAKGMGFDERIGNKFLNAGVGFGGSCLPKDLGGLISKSRQIGYDSKLLQEVLNLNDKQALRIIELLGRHTRLKDATVGILGLSFKPGTDDVRDSMSIKVVRALLQAGARVKAYDPMAMENFRKLFPQIEYVTGDEVLDSDALLILTEWEEFNRLDYTGKIVIDGRRVEKAREARIYEGICW